MGTEREERDAALAELDRARSRLREVEAENEKLRKDARAALDVLFDEAVAAHENPHPFYAYPDYLRYRLGTTGHAYELEGFGEVLNRAEQAEADLQEAREALAFYADEDNHLAEIRRAPVTDERYAGPSPVKNDSGERARGVLRKGETEC